MKRLIIASLVLAVMLLFANGSFARWNEGGFKPSPLFKHALSEAIERLEGKAEASGSGGNGVEMNTSEPGCVRPFLPPTDAQICETYESTCEGEYTCYGYYTCWGQQTCQSTCGSTCSGNTCGSTCQNTCPGYCPWLMGYCLYNGQQYNWSNWPEAYREVRIYNEAGKKLESAGFAWNGWYEIRSRRYQPLILKGHASKAGYNEWIHRVGDEKFIQYPMTGYLNLDLNEEYRNDHPEWD